jgi:undecaprenyl diphosphate synthase
MPEKLKAPEHLGIIPDGNRRWAEQNGLPVIEGHRRGYRTFRKIAPAAMDMGVKYVSAFGFSTENWERSEEEVTGLMSLLKWIAKKEVRSLDRENIRVRFAGSEEGLDSEIVGALRAAEEKTETNTRGQLILCINYGGQQEIVDAVRAIASEGLDPGQIDKKTIAEHMYVPDLPPVDLLIRTSGEQRMSNFMPWQASYAELMFPDKLWPDFTPEDLAGCINEFSERQRRFGG